MAEFKHIIRIANTDLKGEKPIGHALRKIKGVGVMYANMVCKIAGVDHYKKAGDLIDAEAKKLGEIIKDPLKYGAPKWMLNRRKDVETGEDKHIIMGDLEFTNDADIKRMKKTKCYRGMRHAWGLPVRGQRTKSNFRKNKGKGSLGVSRKKVGKK
ncbi:MAG: 30S ribosomal protein S13 [archaeon]